MKIKYLTVLLALSTSAYAGEFKLVSNNKTQAVSNILAEITTELPQLMKESIGKTVTVEFKNLNKTEISSIDTKCSANIILGRDLMIGANDSIEVDNVFAKEIQRGNKALDCNHKDIKTYMKATIVHELAHMYDQKTKASKNSLFLNISGWVSKGVIVKKRTNLNQLDERSPDRYEFKSSIETFAVNFEYFMYDPEYKCRRETYYEFYANQFGSKPNANIACEAVKKIMVTSETTGQTKEDSLVRSLDFDRLYQIHYLFAGKGTAMMSRFGHAMYRLVFCAPGKEKGPSCMNDSAYHVVVSFRANVQELTTSYAKGMNGEYPSQLFFLSLPEVVDEYTKGEFREVTSVPLKLTVAQQKRFLTRAAELYWGYKGKYYFFTNNCATEALNLLKVARNEQDQLQDKDMLTPIGLFNNFNKMGITDMSVLVNKDEAQKKGYYYPGVSSKVLASLKILEIKEDQLQKFVQNNNAAKRMEVYKKAMNKNANKVMIAANALRLEDLIMRSEEIGFAKKVGSQIFGDKPNERLKGEIGERVVELQKMQSELSPEHFLAPGYGVPLKGEFDTIPQDKINDVSERAKEYAEDLKAVIREFFPSEIAEIQKTSENRVALLNIIGGK